MVASRRDSSYTVHSWSRWPTQARVRGPSPAQPAVERFVARHDDLRREPLARARLGGAPEGAASRLVVDQGLQRRGERGDVTGRHEQAALVVLHHLRDTAHARGDARAAEAHGFEDAEAEAFGVGCVEADVGDLKILLDGVDLLADYHAVGQAEAPHVADERCERLAGEDEELEGLAGTHARGGLQQEVDALARAQVGGVHHEHFVAEAELAADDTGPAAGPAAA